jgi:preprotein translocase subunit YajC
MLEQLTVLQGQNLMPVFHLIIISLVVFLIFLVVVILPSAREQKRREEKLNSLKQGDTVMLTSGIIGTFVRWDQTVAVVEICPKCHIKVEKSAIREKL